MLINWDGSISINSSMADVGMGGQIMLVNIVIETFTTRSTMVIGNAARLAAEEIKDKIGMIAAEILGVLKEECVAENEVFE